MGNIFRLCVHYMPSKWTFSLVSSTKEILSEWRCLIMIFCIFTVAPVPPIQNWNLLRTCLPANDPGYAAPYGHWWLHISPVLYSSATERLTTEHEVGGSNHRETNSFKSEETNWKKLKLWSVSYVILDVWWKVGVQRRWTRYSILDMSSSVDSCARKHANVYGENRQPCLNLSEPGYWLRGNSSRNFKSSTDKNFRWTTL